MKENISCILANTRKTSHIPVWETSTSHERYCTNRGRPLQESLPIRVAWFTAAAALVATFTLMGVWTVRMALADYRFRQETLPGTQEALRLEPDSAGYYVRLAAIIQESNPVASTEALQRAVALNRWDSQFRRPGGRRAEPAARRQCRPEVLTQLVSGELLFPARRLREVLVLGAAGNPDG